MTPPAKDGIVRNRTRSQRAHGQSGRASSLARPHRETRLDPALTALPMLRTSERGTFKRCHWLWWHEFVELRKPIYSAPALRFGSLIHLALRDRYPKGIRRGPHPAKSFAKHYEAELKALEVLSIRVEDMDTDSAEKWVAAGDLGEAMLTAYVDKYGKDDEWEVVATEQAFKVLVYHPVTKQPWFWYTGILDGIWRNRRNKKLYIVDHKTARAIQLGYLALDGQATGYWTWGLDWIYQQGLLRPNEKLAGMLYNHLRKAMPDERPFEMNGKQKVYLNKDGSPSKRQPTPYFARTPIHRAWHEREAARQQVIEEFLDMERIKQASVERGSLFTDSPLPQSDPPPEAYKNQGQFTCPGCPAFDYCELHEIGADWNELRDMTTREWDPYEAHVIYTDETH